MSQGRRCSPSSTTPLPEITVTARPIPIVRRPRRLFPVSPRAGARSARTAPGRNSRSAAAASANQRPAGRPLPQQGVLPIVDGSNLQPSTVRTERTKIPAATATAQALAICCFPNPAITGSTFAPGRLEAGPNHPGSSTSIGVGIIENGK